jgi:hypothetical protein
MGGAVGPPSPLDPTPLFRRGPRRPTKPPTNGNERPRSVADPVRTLGAAASQDFAPAQHAHQSLSFIGVRCSTNDLRGRQKSESR